MLKSDNNVPVHPDIQAAIQAAWSAGDHAPYGQDAFTAALNKVCSEIFDRQAFVFPVVTGTAGNNLALRVLSAGVPGKVLTAEGSHLQQLEGMAPELLGGVSIQPVEYFSNKTALNVSPFDAPACREVFNRLVNPHQLQRMFDQRTSLEEFHGAPLIGFSISQADEQGQVYTPEEMQALIQTAKAHDLFVHIDGARLANAIAGADPDVNVDDAYEALREQTQGVDAICLGASKNGGSDVEALIFFDQSVAKRFFTFAKSFGHLPAKAYARSAELLAYFKDGLWVKNAAHANAMAALLREKIGQTEKRSAVTANQVFLPLSDETIQALNAEGIEPYHWPCKLPEGAEGKVYRLVTAWQTQPDDVEQAANIINRHEECLYHNAHLGVSSMITGMTLRNLVPSS